MDNPYPQIGDDLVQRNAEVNENRMFFHQGYANDNFLLSLTPQDGFEEKFFGTKILNVFVIQKPYGWNKGSDGLYTFEWPPDGWDEAVARHNDNFDRYRFYRTLIYGDMWTANKIKEENPASDYPDMMNETIDKIKAVVLDIKGFEYKRTFDEQPDASTFFQDITDFFRTVTPENR